MPRLQRTLEEHCFSEDSEAVARLNFDSSESVRSEGGFALVPKLELGNETRNETRRAYSLWWCIAKTRPHSTLSPLTACFVPTRG